MVGHCIAGFYVYVLRGKCGTIKKVKKIEVHEIKYLMYLILQILECLWHIP